MLAPFLAAEVPQEVHVWTAPLRQALSWRGDDCGRCSHVSGLFGAAILTTAGPDVVREVGPDQLVVLDTRNPIEGSTPSTTDRSTSCHQHLRNPCRLKACSTQFWRCHRGRR